MNLDMLEFIQLLKERYRHVLNGLQKDSSQKPAYQANFDSIELAEAFLKKGRIIDEQPEHPLQIAIIGPTQAGKSSIVNLLLQNTYAGVSPLAGYTIHPQGFCLNIQESSCAGLWEFFKPYQRYPQDSLPRDQLEAFALTETQPNPNSPIKPGVIWDTPDFDSIDAEGYREGFLLATALADVILLVVSKDKYADQSVWEMMDMLEPMGQPTLVCINKLNEGTREIIVPSLLEKWQGVRDDKPLAVCTLPYRKEGFAADTMKTEMEVLVKSLNNAIAKIKRKHQPRHASNLLKTHWPAWTTPVKAEYQLNEQWAQLVDAQIGEALAVYQRDYLNHPQHYETFQRALAELLTLLEVPGIAAVLSRTRRLMTWPIRQIFKIGRGKHNDDSSQEIEILGQVQKHFYLQLSEALIEKNEEDANLEPWWKQIGAQLRNDRPALTERFSASMQEYHKDFQPVIENTANQLYAKLQEQPAILNSLRATRITTDAAALAIAFHTGGIGVHDFILAPAVLSVTSILTEGALGTYINKISANLKKQQLETVKHKLFEDILRDSLIQLPGKLNPADKFNIPAETLAKAENQLKEKRHGLQLF